MKPHLRTVFSAILGISGLVLAGCSTTSEVPEAKSIGEHSTGIPIVAGTWPFSSSERCGDENPPTEIACLWIDNEVGPRLSGLAAKDAVFTSAHGLTITHRGGLLVREATTDYDNPNRHVLLGFFDIRFPEEKPTDGLRDLVFTSEGIQGLGFAAQGMGSGVEVTWPNAERARGDLYYSPEPGGSLTVAYLSTVAGPASLLSEDDEYLLVVSDYRGDLEWEDTTNSAYFALLNQDPEDAVLDDLLESMQRISAGHEHGDGGMESLNRYLSRWLDGAPLISTNTLNDAPQVEADHAEQPGSTPGTNIPPPPADYTPYEEANLDGGYGPFDDGDMGGGYGPFDHGSPHQPADGALSADELYFRGIDDATYDMHNGYPFGTSFMDPDPSRDDYSQGYDDGWDVIGDGKLPDF